MSLPSTTQPYHPYTVSRTSPVLSVNGQTGNAAIYPTSVPSGNNTASNAWRLQAVKGDLFTNTDTIKIQQATSTGNGVVPCSIRTV